MPSWAQSGIPLVVFLFFVVFFRHFISQSLGFTKLTRSNLDFD